jgi:hypothetical protein
MNERRPWGMYVFLGFLAILVLIAMVKDFAN